MVKLGVRGPLDLLCLQSDLVRHSNAYGGFDILGL